MVVFWHDIGVETYGGRMSKPGERLLKFFRSLGLTLFQSEAETVVLYPEDFKQRVKAEYHNPALWLALDHTDHVLVGRYLERNCHPEPLDPQWVIEMCKQKRYREVKEMAEAIQNRSARRKQIYDEWHKMVTGETLESLYQRFVQTDPVESIKKKFW